MLPNEKQFYVQFSGQTIATSPEEAVHIAMDQVADGSAHVEVTDDHRNTWEPDFHQIVAQRRDPGHAPMVASGELTYDLVVNAARRLAQTLSPEQKDLLAALGTADTPEKAQIVKEIAAAVLAEDAAPSAEQQDALVLANVRYAVGRSTGVVGTTVDLAIARWPDLSDATRDAILDEVSYAVANGKAGMEMDEAEWNRLVAHASPSPSPKG